MIKRNLNYDLGIKKVLHQVHPTLQIKNISVELINNMIIVFAKKLIKTSEIMSKLSKKTTINNKELKTAGRLIIPVELMRHSISEGQKAINVYKSKKNITNKKSQEYKAGLQFKVSITRNIIKKEVGKNTRISHEYSIFLTAMLEYITAEILDLTGNFIISEKKTRITPRDIMISIRNDSELNNLFNGFILGTGVVPNIHSELLNGGKIGKNILKENLNKISKSGLRRLMYRAGIKYVSGLIYEESRLIIESLLKQIIQHTIVIVEQKKHTTFMYEDGIETLKLLNIDVYSVRGFPGKKPPCKGSQNLTINDNSKSIKKRKPKVHLLKIIRKYQKTDCTLLQHKPMERLIREISSQFTFKNMVFESDFIWLIHSVIENYMIKFYQDALLLVLHAGRTTVQPRDLVLLKKIRSMV